MKRVLSLFLVLLLGFPSIAARAQPDLPGYSMGDNLYWPLLKRGQTKAKVRILQKLLNAKGFRVEDDGKFGASTERAVRAFQKFRKLDINGIVDGPTWEKLVVPIHRGSRGPMVRIFQTLLDKTGRPVKQDGIFGAATEKAVRNYQRKEGEKIMVDNGRAEIWVWCWLLGGMNISD